jgi:5-methyltetrahydropteroyltriglutamate--homocysteine methyltransferase
MTVAREDGGSASGAARSPRDRPPFRAEHVGSLLRPPELLSAREHHAIGAIDADELHAIEDAAIAEAVRMQEDTGLRTITDGEFRRASWHMDFIYQIGGVVKAQSNLRSVFHNESGDIEYTPSAAHVVERLELSEPIFADAFTFLTSTVHTGTPKLTMPSPSMVHYRGGRAAIDAEIYPEMDRFWHDLADVYAEQIRRIAELGCSHIQLDDTSLAYLNDPRERAAFDKRGEDGEHQHITYIDTINRALADRPAGLTVTTHMCRGNFRSSWVAAGGYDFIAEPLFSELGVDGFYMEYDDERSGSFAPLRFVPKGKTVVLGLVTSKRPGLEPKDRLKRRIEEASQYIDIDQLCLSPQCGFASTVDGNALTIDQEIAKLRLVVETAEEVWGTAG